MTLQTAMIGFLILLWAVSQYGLAAWAVRDLRSRESVRGGNKVGWALAILCVPIFGALVYSVYGPTSLRRRPAPPVGPDDGEDGFTPVGMPRTFGE